jgi:DNA-(apurinic or apyrimidinic site) lyase
LRERDDSHQVHSEDTNEYDSNARLKKILDIGPYTAEADRSWLFHSIGYGHGEIHWKDVIPTLRVVGHQGALSTEHEDSLTSGREGLDKAVNVLSQAVFETQPGDTYWA